MFPRQGSRSGPPGVAASALPPTYDKSRASASVWLMHGGRRILATLVQVLVRCDSCWLTGTTSAAENRHARGRCTWA